MVCVRIVQFVGVCVFFLVAVCVCFFNPQTYAQGHTPTVIQGGGGGGLMEPLPRVFEMLQYLETILPSVESH